MYAFRDFYAPEWTFDVWNEARVAVTIYIIARARTHTHTHAHTRATIELSRSKHEQHSFT